MRADEACHRDVNHHLADKYYGNESDSYPELMQSDLRNDDMHSFDTWHPNGKEEKKE